MSIELMIKNLYYQAFKNILDVYEIFKDYFDEERVDLQDIISIDTFSEYISNTEYSEYLSKSFIVDSPLFKSYEDEIKIIIKALLEEGALKSKIATDYTVFRFLYPFLYDRIPLRRVTASIIVHFPEVRVTNENDKYVDIKDLYARVKVTHNGNIVGTFGLNRTNYPVSHLMADYMHSHIPGLNLNSPKSFLNPCLGSGPINDTILTLVGNADLSMWMLFCRELDMYVTVESLSGIPYRHLERITGTRKLKKCSSVFRPTFPNYPITSTIALSSDEISNFIKYVIDKNVIKFTYSNGSYNLAMSYLNYILSISNSFIEYVNTKLERTPEVLERFTQESLYRNNILIPHAIINNSLHEFTSSVSNTNYMEYNGRESITFKGNTLKLYIYDDSQSENSNNEVLILNKDFCHCLLFHILTYLNIKHGKINNSQSNPETGSFKECIIL